MQAKEEARRCARHPEARATHTCDGCSEDLCMDCVEVGHALLFCRLCGERALPVGPVTPDASTARSSAPAERAGYGLRAALAYPLRGHGRRIFGVLCLVTTSAAMLPTVLPQLVMLVVASSLSLAIVRATAHGANEAPAWPSPWAVRERFADAAAWVGARLLQLLLFAFVIVQAGDGALFRRPPSLAFWLVAALCLWLGTALGMASLGAAGAISRIQAANLLGHVRGLMRLGLDGVNATNLLFGLGALVLLVRGQLTAGDAGAASRLLGQTLSGVSSAYWILLEPHLVGLVFRRNLAVLSEAYGLASEGSASETR